MVGEIREEILVDLFEEVVAFINRVSRLRRSSNGIVASGLFATKKSVQSPYACTQ